MAPERTLIGVHVDRDVHRGLKDRCAANGLTQSFVVDQLIRRFLDWPAFEVRLLKTKEKDEGLQDK